jgi:hypothetical protein
VLLHRPVHRGVLDGQRHPAAAAADPRRRVVRPASWSRRSTRCSTAWSTRAQPAESG